MKKYNFSAGPAAIPRSVLERAKQQFVDFEGYGLSLMELSHRGKVYNQVHNDCIELLQELMEIPETHKVLLLGGGATLQFGMVPMNLLHGPDDKVSQALTGAWSLKALNDLEILSNRVEIVYDGRKENYSNIPDHLSCDPESKYLSLCSNETINGVQWHYWPGVSCPIAADMSSDFLSRPLPWDRFGIVYAGAQKNLGPAGLCVVIIREDLLSSCNPSLPAYLRYPIHAKNNSLYNTPPGLIIYLVKLQLEWLRDLGGVAAIERQNRRKAEKLYQAIDESDGFYQNHVNQPARSIMTVPFSLPDKELEEKFLQDADENGFEGLRGHRSVGGIRASIYNAVSEQNVDILVHFMKQFQEYYSS